MTLTLLSLASAKQHLLSKAGHSEMLVHSVQAAGLYFEQVDLDLQSYVAAGAVVQESTAEDSPKH